MSLLSVVLLVLAVLVVLGAEWPRLLRTARVEPAQHRGRSRAQRKAQLRLVRREPEPPSAVDDEDDFVASVRRDLDRLPTFDRDKDR